MRENSIAFSDKLSLRRRIINLDLYFTRNYCFNNAFLMRQSVIGSIWRYLNLYYSVWAECQMLIIKYIAELVAYALSPADSLVDVSV